MMALCWAFRGRDVLPSAVPRKEVPKKALSLETYKEILKGSAETAKKCIRQKDISACEKIRKESYSVIRDTYNQNNGNWARNNWDVIKGDVKSVWRRFLSAHKILEERSMSMRKGDSFSCALKTGVEPGHFRGGDLSSLSKLIETHVECEKSYFVRPDIGPKY